MVSVNDDDDEVIAHPEDHPFFTDALPEEEREYFLTPFAATFILTLMLLGIGFLVAFLTVHQ